MFSFPGDIARDIYREREAERGDEEEEKKGEYNLMKGRDYSPDSTAGSVSASQVCSVLTRLPHTTQPRH